MSTTGLEIAVIGMSGRFPGAKDIEAFWSNLKNGRESISFFSEEELSAGGENPRTIENPDYVKAIGRLEDIEYFDSAFFGYTPMEAEMMDPQVRIFHQCAWQALEDAGYASETYDGLIGLYAGASPNFKWEASTFLSGDPGNVGFFSAFQLRDKDFMSLRVSYKLNLIGPSFSLYTACSTSLLAIHLACQGLLNGEADIALAGGVTVTTLKDEGYLYQAGMVLSPDGHCRAFDARAKGLVPGNGTAIVVLKRLAEAVADGDHIEAVIKGSAINNDGIRKPGFTAPSIEGQAEVIKTALHMAEVEPETIGYVETHGTGTVLGDPVEIEGLKLAFNTDNKGFCRIGAVKTNIGHLDSAAGVAGFIKTVLALKHNAIPPTLHFNTANPKIDFENSPFTVNATLTPWVKHPSSPRRAGISSFGIGGTNVHIILEEAPPGKNTAAANPYHLLVFSAKTEAALNRATENFLEYLKKNPSLNLADAAYTLQVGRREFEHKRQLVCTTTEEAISILSSPNSRKVQTYFSKKEESRGKPVIFMIPGLGGQYVNMGLELYQRDPFFRQQLDTCFTILDGIGCRIKNLLFPATPSEEAQQKLNRAEVSQPVIFSVEYALAQWIMKRGIKPRAMIGYSFGEYIAACLAGVFTLEDALRLIVSRGQLIEKVPAGLMVSVPMEAEALKPFLGEELSLSIDNGPSCIVSGPVPAIEALEKEMKKQRALCMRLQATRAIHSGMMEPILTEFTEKVKAIPRQKPQIPYISNVTGDWIKVTDATDPAYWARHLRETVQLAKGLETLIDGEGSVFVEVGPGRDLSAMVSRHLEKNPQHQVINLMKPAGKDVPDDYYLQTKMGQLWMLGVNLDWSQFYPGGAGYRVSLPSYSFEALKFPVKEDPFKLIREKTANASLEPREEAGIADWYYIPSWKRSNPPVPGGAGNRPGADPEPWLIFADDSPLSTHLVKHLAEERGNVVTVHRGLEFRRIREREYTLDPREPEHYVTLFNELKTSKQIPHKLVHLWSLDEQADQGSAGDSFDRAQERGFYSLLYMVKAFASLQAAHPLEIDVITNEVHDVTGDERLHPENSTLLGPVKVIPQEYPGIRCKHIDILRPDTGSPQENTLLRQLSAELTRNSSDTVIAYRGSQRWEQTFEPLHLPEPQERDYRLKQEGVYLVTGGLGKIGLVMAEYLATTVKARLILTGRSPIPPREEWEQWLTTHSRQDEVSAKIEKLLHLETLGAKVMAFSVDVARREEMQRVIAQAEAAFGPVNGVIHNAGLISGDSIKTFRQISREQCQVQFQAKVYGLHVLEDLLQGKALDFCWIMSSVASVLGGLEFFAYSAANIFMDTFVCRHNRSHAKKWISVNWDRMEAEETASAFRRILSLEQVNQVVVSTGGNLQTKIRQWIKLESLRDEGEADRQETSSAQERPGVLNDYIAPRNPTEELIAGIWKKLLGFKEIGVRDDFLELGGDSLKAITVIARIQKALAVEVPITEFFNRPTVESLAEYIENTEKGTFLAIEPVEKREYYEPAHPQKRLWILDQLGEDPLAYNVPAAFTYENLNREAFTRVFTTLVKRHETLRTTFIKVDGNPKQKIHDHESLGFRVEYIDLRERQDREETAKKLERAELETGFALDKGPLLRAKLLHMDDKVYRFLYTMHHIVSDAWSIDILLHEISTLYHSYSQNLENPLPPLKIQYKDFSAWQNRALSGEKLKEHQDYWQEQFKGKIPILDLKTDYPRPAVKTLNGSRIDLVLAKEVSESLHQLGKKVGTSLFMTLLAAINALLYGYTAQEDMIIGTPVAGREHGDLDNQIGHYLNTLPLRAKFSAGDSFAALLDNLKDVTLNAYKHQLYPFDCLLNDLDVSRDPSRSPLFDVMVQLLNTEIPLESGNPGEKMYREGHGLDISKSKYDLVFNFYEGTDTINLFLEYNVDLFAYKTIARLLNRFESVIAAIIADPEIRIRDLFIREEIRLPVIQPPAETASPPLHGPAPEPLPASYHQQRLWFIDKFEAGTLYEKSPTYHNIPLIIDIRGPLDTGLLERSISKVMARHEALRTKIITVKDQACQQIDPPAPFRLSGSETLPPQGDGDQYRQGLELAVESSREPFVINSETLGRGKLIRLEENRSLLALTLHHLIADYDSLGIIAREIACYYEALLNDDPDPELPGLPFHYADFSRTQRNFSDHLLDSLLFYWRRKLHGKLQALELPTDFPRAAIHVYEEGRQEFTLPGVLTDKMTAISQRAGVNEKVVLLAAFKILLSRYSGLEEIVVGTSAPNRAQSGTEGVVGPLANLLVLRSHFSGTTPFPDLLADLQQTLADAYKYQAMPFDQLVLELNPQKDMSRTALFDVLFQYEEKPTPSIHIGNLEFTRVETNLGWGKYDLNMWVQRSENAYRGILVYNRKYYTGAAMSRLLDHYAILLESLCQDPAGQIASFSLLTESERRRLLVEWNRTGAGYPRDKTLHQIFAEQVEKNPRHIAVSFADRQLSYGELSHRAQGLARELRNRCQVRPNDLVAIMLNRSEWMVAGLLGILIAGAAYLPINPDYPAERIKYLLEDSQCSRLVTETELKNTLDISFGGECLDILAQPVDTGAENPDPPIGLNNPDDTAYVIYTSGTTGHPKGCMVSHRNVVRLLINEKLPFDFSHNDVWIMTHTFCFDFSVWEMYGALLYGARLVVPAWETVQNISRFRAFIKRHNITVLNQTPRAFYTLIEEEKKAEEKSLGTHLRYICFGGDKLEPHYLKEWAEFYSPTEIRLINMFGITETTVHVTFHQITPGDIHAPGKSSPIGKPLPETTVYVLNEHLEPVPVGIPGQLYVGGSGVSKGYLHKDALTRERFIENPHKAGEIIYKTGDLGKWLPGGSLEYLDRMDNQIQLRGYRVELGEIDYHLLKHEEIDEALTIARTDIRGEKYLCSYLVSREKLTAPALREDLAGKLPDYMIPSHFFQLDAIPLNSSGKPDLNGLQTYGRPLEAGEDYIAPESEIEKKIADIWKEVIQVEKTGVNDNFFEIGGNSLNIVQVKSKLKDVFGIDIPIAVMFEYPTIRSFVHYLEQQKNGEAWQEKEIEDIDSKQDEAIMVIEETMQLIDEGEND